MVKSAANERVSKRRVSKRRICYSCLNKGKVCACIARKKTSQAQTFSPSEKNHLSRVSRSAMPSSSPECPDMPTPVMNRIEFTPVSLSPPPVINDNTWTDNYDMPPLGPIEFLRRLFGFDI